MKKTIIGSVLLLFSNSVLAAEMEFSLTEYGHPDFQGVWNFSTSTPLERADEYGETEFLSDDEIFEHKTNRENTWDSYIAIDSNISSRILNAVKARSVGSVNLFWGELHPLRENRRTSLIVHPDDGKIPSVQPGVVVQKGDPTGITEIPGIRPVRYTHGGIGGAGPEDRGLSERCLVFNSGPPLLAGAYNNNIQIVQNSDHVAILVEMGNDARIIPLDQRLHAPERIKLWSGDSRGYFDGNTLVVETRNFTDQIASLGLQGVAYGSGGSRTLTERFTRTGVETMDYEFTIDDPETFTDKLVAVIPMTKTTARIFEYACHAGNYAIANILAGARQEEKVITQTN